MRYLSDTDREVNAINDCQDSVNPDYSNNNDIKCKYWETFNSNHAAQTQSRDIKNST